MTGINENVEVLGRIFHVQTELTPGDDPKIRTAVFLGGRMIASRTNPVSPEVIKESDVRDLIRAQQAQIIDNFVSRAAALAGSAADGTQPAAKASGPARKSPPPVKATEPPDAEADPLLAEAIAVRRLITRFRQSLRGSSDISDDDFEPFLKNVALAVRRVTEDPAFVGVRLTF